MIDLFFLYMFIKRLVTPFDKWKAYEEGIIDAEGNIIKPPEVRKRTIKDRDAFTKFDLMVLKLKKLLAKVPGGQTRFATYAAALWLIKEHKDLNAPILNEQATADSIIGYMTYIEKNHGLNMKFEDLLAEDATMSAGVKSNSGIGLTIFDIDETLMRTTAQIKVVKGGKLVRSLTNQEFNNYKLQPGEEFDFGEFRNAEKFRRESKPIVPMIAKLKAILHNAGDSKVIMLTARADFDDKKTFLNTFRDLGIDMSRVYVHRTGNLGGSPAENKKVFIRQYLDTGKYSRVRLYDDAMSNIKMFNQIAKDYPDVKFYPYLVTHDGRIKTVRENFADSKMNNVLNMKFEDLLAEDATMSAGGGQVAGIGVGPKGEPGVTPAAMKRYKSKNKSLKRFKEIAK